MTVGEEEVKSTCSRDLGLIYWVFHLDLPSPGQKLINFQDIETLNQKKCDLINLIELCYLGG